MSRTLNARAALRAVRRYLVVPLVGVGIGIAAAQSLTGRIPPTYATDASVVITASTVDPTTRAKVADLALAQGLAPTVAQLVESREVALFTAASLKLPPGAVAGHVKGSYQRGTQVVTIRATAPSATGASTIANAAARATMRQFALLQVGVGGNVAIQLLDQASPPAAPRSPDRRLYDAAGALAGLLVGLGLTWLGGRADDRLRRPARFGSLLGLPVLGTFPRLPCRYARRNARTLYTRRGVAGAAAGTVAALSVLTSPLPRRRVLVTSVRDDDGKGLVCALLALALAEGQDRVTLIEGQPRRPGVGGHFPQATEYAAAKAFAGNGARVPPIPGSATLSVVAGGQGRRSAPASGGAQKTRGRGTGGSETGGTEIGGTEIGGTEIGRLIDAAADGGAIAVVNAPPVLAGAGLATLARYADGLLLVVRMGVTRRTDAQRAVALIRLLGLPVVGVVAVDAAGRARPERYPDLSLPAPTVPEAPTASRRAPTPLPAPTPVPAPIPAPPVAAAVSPAVRAVSPDVAAFPDVAAKVEAPPAARHRRREAVDALSAPFDLVTESLELAALADEDTVHPLPAGNAGAADAPRPTGPESGVNAGPNQPWRLSPGRSVPGSRHAENAQPKEFA